MHGKCQRVEFIDLYHMISCLWNGMQKSFWFNDIEFKQVENDISLIFAFFFVRSPFISFPPHQHHRHSILIKSNPKVRLKSTVEQTFLFSSQQRINCDSKQVSFHSNWIFPVSRWWRKVVDSLHLINNCHALNYGVVVDGLLKHRVVACYRTDVSKSPSI